MNTNTQGGKTMAGNTSNGGGRRWSRWRIAAWSAPVLIMLVPLVAMQFTDEVNWTAFDFVFASVLLFGSLGLYELAAKLTGNTLYRAAVGVAVATSLVLTWVNGAVGVIGDGPVNLLYFGVIAVGIIGAIMARCQPLGMSRTLFAMAFVQMLVPVIALVIWKAGGQDLLIDPNSPHPPFDPGIAQVFMLNGFFAMLFIGSAGLFREAARGMIAGNAV